MSVSTALATTTRAGLIPTGAEWNGMLRMADDLVKSGLLPAHIKTPQAAVAIIQKGVELGIPPMYALSNITVIQGKPTVSPEVMRALIFRDHGADALVYLHMGGDYCEMEYRRRGAKKGGTMRFTMDDAIAAGLPSGPNGGTWKKYPSAMLSARCTSLIAKAMFADSVGGLYTPDEFDVPVNEDGEAIHEPVRATVTPIRTDADGAVIEPSRPVASAAELKKLWAVAKGNDWTEIDLRALVAERFTDAVDSEGQPSLRMLTSDEVTVLLDLVNPPGMYDEPTQDALIVDDEA